MSEPQGAAAALADDRLERYLQFTPLVSIISPRSLIDVFQGPATTVLPIVRSEHAESAEEPAVRDQVLSQVLDRARAVRYQIYIKDSPSMDFHKSPFRSSLPLETGVERLLQQYRIARQEIHCGLEPSNVSPLKISLGEHRSTTLVPQNLCESEAPDSTSDLLSINDRTPSKLISSRGYRSPFSDKRVLSERAEIPDSPSKRQKTKTTIVGIPRTPSKLVKLAHTEFALLSDRKTDKSNLLSSTRAFIEDIFESDDYLVEDTSEKSGATSTTMFCASHTDSHLTLEILLRLLSVLRKSALLGVLHDIDVDDLLRLQKILLRSSISSALGKSKQLEHEVQSPSAEEQWIAYINDLQGFLSSSLCIMHIMQGVRENRQLCSEETLIYIIDGARNIAEDTFLRWLTEASKEKLHWPVKHRLLLETLVQTYIAMFHEFAALLAAVEVSENVLSRLEFLAIELTFAQSTTTCSENLRLTTSLEALKIASVCTLQDIFIKFSDQGQFILDEVLTNLSKLTLDRQKRHYKLSNGKSVQLCSVLLLRLVQSSVMVDSSCEAAEGASTSRSDKLIAMSNSVEATTNSMTHKQLRETESHAPLDYSSQLESANKTARYIVQFLLSRSMRSTKSSEVEDGPLRALLESIIEDLSVLLHFPEYPAAEIVLCWLAKSMIGFLDDAKQSTLSKAYALDVTSIIASKIRQLILSTQGTTMTLLGQEIIPARITNFRLSGETTPEQLDELVSAIECLCGWLLHKSQIQETYKSAYEYYITTWIVNLTYYQTSLDCGHTLTGKVSAVTQSIIRRHTLGDTTAWSTTGSIVSEECIGHIHLQLVKFSNLLSMFDAMLARLLSTMESSQVTLRTKALRNLANLSAIDSSLLSKKAVQAQVAMRVSDNSPQVRDVALDLLGRYIAANPHLGIQYYKILKDRAMDSGTSVRKRVLRIAKELFVKNDDTDLRVDILCSFLLSLNDEEESIQELVHKTVEEVLFQHLEANSNFSFDELSPRAKEDLKARGLVIAKLASINLQDIPELFKQLLTEVCSRSISKYEPRKILSLVIQYFFHQIVSSSDDVQRLTCLIATKVLSESVPALFSASQIEGLLPYVLRGDGKFEQNAPFYVASIYTEILPRLASRNMQFLSDLHSSLLTQLTRLPARTLTKVVPCLCEVVRLRSDYVRVARTLMSCMQKTEMLLPKSKSSCFLNEDWRALNLLLNLLGLFGRFLEVPSAEVLKQVFELDSQSALVSSILKIMRPLWTTAADRVPDFILLTSLQSVGDMCVAHPSFFLDRDVMTYLDSVVDGSNIELKRRLISIWREYLSIEQQKIDLIVRAKQQQEQAHCKTKRVTQLVTIDVAILTGNTDRFAHDGISTSLMQRYLQFILDCALGIDLSLAIASLDLVEHVVRQGLVNPRNCVPTIIALETSDEAKLSTVAARTHRALKDKHESLIDTCYLDGVKLAFRYQKSQRPVEGINRPAKIASISRLYDIVRSSRQGRKRFLATIARSLDFNLEKIATLALSDIEYSYFIVHNLASIAYTTHEEIHHVLFTIDRTLSNTGMTLLHALDNKEAADGDHLGRHTKGLYYACTMMSYNLQLRARLMLVYNISEAKCRTFEPNRPTAKHDTRSAIRQVGVALQPEWQKPTPDSFTSDRVLEFQELFRKDAYHLHVEALGLSVALADGEELNDNLTRSDGGEESDELTI